MKISYCKQGNSECLSLLVHLFKDVQGVYSLPHVYALSCILLNPLPNVILENLIHFQDIKIYDNLPV